LGWERNNWLIPKAQAIKKKKRQDKQKQKKKKKKKKKKQNQLQNKSKHKKLYMFFSGLSVLSPTVSHSLLPST